MNLYLLRHGRAMERDPKRFPDDDLRPLTLQGEDRVRRCCESFRTLELWFDVILSSPVLRARQTAETVAAELGLQRKLQFVEALRPDCNREEIISAINSLTPRRSEVLIVGHQPALSQLLSILISGSADAAIELKKNSLAKIKLTGRLRSGRCGELNWLLSPRQLSSIS